MKALNDLWVILLRSAGKRGHKEMILIPPCKNRSPTQETEVSLNRVKQTFKLNKDTI